MKIIKFILLFTFSLNLFANNIILTDKEKHYLKQHPVIKVSNENDWPPFDYMENGKPIGYSIDLLNIIAKKLDVKFEYVNNLNWNELLTAFQKGDIDLFHSIYKSKERSKYAIFSKPFYKNRLAVFTNKSLQITSLKDLEGKTVAMPKGYAMLEVLQDSIKELKVLEVNSIIDAIFAVASKKADYIVDSAATIQNIIINEAIPNIELSFFPQFSKYDTNAFSLRFATLKENPTLLSIIEKANESLTFKEKRDLQQKWFGNVSIAKKDIISLTKEEKEFLENHPIIKVSNEMDWPPFDFAIGNEPSGYSIDLLKLIEKKIGVKFEFINGHTWGELWQMFEDKQIDITHPVSKNEERKKFGAYTKKLYGGKYIFITKNETKKIHSIKDLKGKVFATPKAWGQTKYLQDNYPEIPLLLTTTDDEAKQAVREGKAYVSMGNDAVTYYNLKKEMDRELKVNALFNEFNNGTDNDLYFLIRKDWPIMYKIFEKAYESITIEEIDKLQNKWFGKKEEDNGKINLTKEESEFITIHPIINVSNEMDYMPFDYSINKKPMGYSIDLLNILSKKIGIDINYINGYSWKQLVEKFKNKELDLIHTAAKTPDREKFALYSKDYYKNQNYFFSKTDTPKINNIKDLFGKTVAVGKGWNQEEYLSLNYPQINLLALNSIDDIVKAVQKGKADAGIENHDTLQYYFTIKKIREIKLDSWFKEFDSKRENNFHFLAQKDASPLISMLNKALDSLTAGEIAQLEQKWFAVIKSEKPTLNTIKEDKILLTAEEKNYLKTKKVLKLCVDPNWMPFDSINETGKQEGMGSDYRDIFSKKINKNIELLKTNSWDESLQKIKDKECDILSLAKKTTTRSKYLNFTEPLITVPYVIATKNDKFFIDNFEDVKNKKFSVIKGFAVADDLKEKYPDINLLLVKDINQGLKKVENGEVYGYIDATAAISYAMEKYGIIDIKVAGKLLLNYELAMGLRNDEPLLFDIFDKLVKSIEIKDRNRIYKKWVAVKHERIVDYSLVWKILIIAFIIIALFGYWNRKVAKANQLLEDAKKEIENKNTKLKELAITDKLTGIYNRAKLDELLQEEINRSERFHHTFGVTLLDIDHFKNVNDTYGHQVGDSVLIEMAAILTKYTRKTDIVGRWGGEEFVIICPESDLNGIMGLIENLRAKIESNDFSVIGQKTASFGVSMYKYGDTIESILKRADDALYNAKESGRNKVVFYENSIKK